MRYKLFIFDLDGTLVDTSPGIMETVRQVDPNAFMIVTSAHEVLGEGFGSYHGEL